MLYIISAVILLVLYALTIRYMTLMRKTRLWNAIFTVLIFSYYIYVAVTVYRSVGFNDWNFKNVLPVANVSPFMFTLVPLIHLLPMKVKKHFYLLISLLSIGMLLSAILGCIYNASINYKFHVHFLSDYLAHVFLSLWGVYLVKSGQVSLTKKNCLISSSIIIGSALCMLILNLIFDTSFFGLSLRGKHNIYNNVLTESSYLSALLYFVGLSGVLGLGYLYSRLLSKKAS